MSSLQYVSLSCSNFYISHVTCCLAYYEARLFDYIVPILKDELHWLSILRGELCWLPILRDKLHWLLVEHKLSVSSLLDNFSSLLLICRKY